MSSHIKLGNCIDRMKQLDENSVDSVVCDPPYGLRFMNKDFDNLGDGAAQREWHKQWAAEAFRVLKPGGYILAFGGSRTYHHLASAIEEVGFEVRDQIMWIYGSGFPKSTNIAKSINKAKGVEFDSKPAEGVGFMNDSDDGYNTTKNQLVQSGESDPEAAEWEGWGTALKPAHEPIVMARKPFVGPAYKNVLEHGTGAINIDDSRVGSEARYNPPTTKGHTPSMGSFENCEGKGSDVEGRWPANLIFGHNEDCELISTEEGEGYAINTFDNGAKPFGDAVGEDYSTSVKKDTVENWSCTEGCAVNLLDQQSGERPGASTNSAPATNNGFARGGSGLPTQKGYGDTGGASRFFYSAKANKKEKSAGLTVEVDNDRFQTRECTQCGKNVPYVGSCGCPNAEITMVAAKPTKNIHPTVKPIDLMRYLIRLVTPVGGTTLDPFLGSGTTGIAAHLEGFNFLGIELDEEYFAIAQQRIEWWSQFEGDTKQILKDND